MKYRDPIFVLVITIFIIVLAGWLRASVLAGCSRVIMGLSPQTINEGIPRYRTTNYGFEWGSYGSKYLGAISKVLDQNSRYKTIILGIAPHNLLNSIVNKNGFIQRKYSRAENGWIDQCSILTSAANYTRPYAPEQIRSLLLGEGVARVEYHPDGWSERDTVRERDDETIEEYQMIFQKEKVSDDVITRLLDQVHLWHKQGIRVYALRIPTSKTMRELENHFSGFNEADFIKRFSEVGGKWIPLDINTYLTWDGSHLQSKSAVKLSRLVGEYIRRDASVLK